MTIISDFEFCCLDLFSHVIVFVLSLVYPWVENEFILVNVLYNVCTNGDVCDVPYPSKNNLLFFMTSFDDVDHLGDLGDVTDIDIFHTRIQ